MSNGGGGIFVYGGGVVIVEAILLFYEIAIGFYVLLFGLIVWCIYTIVTASYEPVKRTIASVILVLCIISLTSLILFSYYTSNFQKDSPVFGKTAIIYVNSDDYSKKELENFYYQINNTNVKVNIYECGVGKKFYLIEFSKKLKKHKNSNNRQDFILKVVKPRKQTMDNLSRFTEFGTVEIDFSKTKLFYPLRFQLTKEGLKQFNSNFSLMEHAKGVDKNIFFDGLTGFDYWL